MARKAPTKVTQSSPETTEPQMHLARRPKSRVKESSIQFNQPHLNLNRLRPSLMRQWPSRMLGIAAVPALIFLAGCGGSSSTGTGTSSNGTLSVSPATVTIDTNCTGCNAINNSGTALEQFSATLTGGGAANVTWAVSGGDTNSGPGTISTSGQYIPPPYLTADNVKVTVTATLASGTGGPTTASATVTVTPGFLEPLSPENAALGANGAVIVTGYIAEAGGSTGITYTTSSSANGSGGGQGSLGTPSCTRSSTEFTHCSVTYSAPATISTTASTYIIGTVGSSSSKTSMQVLLNTAGISSNPATHQVQITTPVLLGSSGGNNNDYDVQGNQIQDCCGGTLGALIQNSGGTQYILSCNHVLARSDQASVGEVIVQPGLIDNNCTPNGGGPGTTQVGVLTTWLPLSSNTTNADAAIAAVDSGAVSPTGAILELGLPSAGGVLAAAPPGISSTAGKGENPTVNMTVAKSGRTTGLTCANISAVNLSVQVSYFTNCEETAPYLTKTYTNQIAVEANQFSDAGDSGSLVVDASDAEPVGLFFAGGESNTGVGEGIANPVSAVLSELGTQEGTSYTFVGTTDHPVSCLNYGNSTATAAQATTLTDAQNALAQQALTQARMLVNPSAGILGVAIGKSSDHAGEATVILYVDQNIAVSAPQMVNGVRTEVIPTTAQAVASGAVPQAAVSPVATESSAVPSLSSTVLNQAIAAKEQVAQSLMKQNPAFFGIGVGQSLDNPREAAMVIYVDRTQVPASLPATINGLRTRYVIMNRLHVTRSYLGGQIRQQSHCMARPRTGQTNGPDLLGKPRLRDLNLQ
jgi:hypothetical protein